jgi:hypothetical protein
MDTLKVSACLSASALTTQRRSAPTLLAPGAPTTPLDALVGCCSWSPQALMNTVTDYGLLICLPAWSSQSVLAALRKVNNPQDRCAVLVPWETTLNPPTPAQIQRETAVTSLLRVGYVAAILIPPALISFSRLESPKPGAHVLSSYSENYKHLLLTSWQASPTQLATLLTALGALAGLRTFNPAESAAHPIAPRPRGPHQCRIEGVTADDTYANLVNTLRAVIIPSSHVIGSPEHIHSTLSHAAALRALRPEEVLTPHLLQPLPLNNSPLTLPTAYAGAALDDDLLPAPNASLGWLHTTTLQHIAAGVLPEAIS